jgi:hypothetical protein
MSGVRFRQLLRLREAGSLKPAATRDIFHYLALAISEITFWQ